MSVLYLAAENFGLTSGITKKIVSQVISLSIIKGECKLVALKFNKVILLRYLNGVLSSEEEFDFISHLKKSYLISEINALCRFANELLANSSNQTLYIRHLMRPSFELIKLMSKARKMKYTIYYEIPTYPYFFEQFSSSKRKILTFLRLFIEVLLWPILYFHLNHLVVIISRKSVHRFKKMVEITNGIDVKNICTHKKDISPDCFRLIGVGSIFKYHGYDRVIRGIADLNGQLKNGMSILFNIIGKSEEIDRLKILSLKLGVSHNVVFHGEKFGTELDKIFEESDVAVACMSLYKRNADTDTTIKLMEYLSRGIVSVTSGNPFNDDGLSHPLVLVRNSNSMIDINQVYQSSLCFEYFDFQAYVIKFRSLYSWHVILKQLFEQTEAEANY